MPFYGQRFGSNFLQKPGGIEEMSSAEEEQFRNLAKSKSGSDYWQRDLFLMPHMKEITI